MNKNKKVNIKFKSNVSPEFVHMHELWIKTPLIRLVSFDDGYTWFKMPCEFWPWCSLEDIAVIGQKQFIPKDKMHYYQERINDAKKTSD